MSEYLRAAREKLRGAIGDIDARLQEIESEEAQLRDHRGQLVVLFGEDVSANASPRVEVRDVNASTTPAVAAQVARPPVVPRQPKRGGKMAEYERRVFGTLSALEWNHLPVIASRLPDMAFDACRLALQRLVRAGLVTAEGSTSSRSYIVSAKGRAKRDADSTPAEPEGDRRASARQR